ncbi:MAG TPA: phage holin family protein [Polyangiales bacterium]
MLADLFEHSETLVRQEVELGKAEIALRVEKAKAAALRGAISAGLYHAAYLTTLATVVLLLCEWVAPWLASLIVALVASAGAVVFTLLGRQALHEIKDPPETRPIMRQRAHT